MPSASASTGTGDVCAAAGIAKAWSGRPVLRGVSCELSPGERVLISGRNGAGKTTLLRILSGLIAADAGRVRVLGLDPDGDRRRYQQRVGFLSAGNAGLYGRLRAEHHLELWARLALITAADRAAAIAEVTDAFTLAPLLGQRVDRLSMGQRQRLRLAAVFLHRPALLLLDEPATSLDAQGIDALSAALQRHAARGGAALLCVPDGWESMLAADRSLRLLDGELCP